MSSTLTCRSKRVDGDLARLELPLPADLGILVVIPPRHCPRLAVPLQPHFYITGPLSPVGAEELDDMVMNEGAWLHRIQPLADHLAQPLAALRPRQAGVI